MIDAKNQDKSELERERVKVYNKMRSAKSPDELTVLKSERDGLSAKIKDVRTELYLLGSVREECDEIRRKILAQRELDARLFEASKPKQKNKSYERDSAR